MHKRIDARLSQWTDFYYQLKNVRAQLASPDQDAIAVTALRAEIARLEASCDDAMRTVQSEIEAVKRLDNPR